MTQRGWIREAHYHALASGSPTELARFGSLYKGELFWAARTWFRRFHNYEHALEALIAVEEMGLQTYEVRMLTAACLVRVGKRKEGESCYRSLISEFPHQTGVKTSFVDSLLNLGEFGDALKTLEEFKLSMRGSNPWVTGQYGRAYFGLYMLNEAIETFKLQLKIDPQSPAIVYRHLANSYYRLGERDKARKTVADGLVFHSDDLALNNHYCANLINSGLPSNLEEAVRILSGLADEYPRNGYILQKLVTAYGLLGDLPKAITRLDRIYWRVEPPQLEKPIRIEACLAQHQFQQALELADTLSAKNEAGQATMRKVFLSWANAEQNNEKKRRVAEQGLEREVPRSCQRNVPILMMYAQLARIAGDHYRIEKTLRQIREINPHAMEDIDPFDRWEDFDLELT